MADSNVLKAQKYLNAMFGGHPSWKKLDEDGYTGSGVIFSSWKHSSSR